MHSLLLSPIDNLIPQWSPHPPPSFLDSALFSPSDSCSSLPSPSPSPDTIHVVCNVPLIAPRPLPYHSPTFLQFDLPDTDEDLSHPPYTHRPSKRKRDNNDNDDPAPQPKRRPGTNRCRSRLCYRPWDHPPHLHLSHRAGNNRTRT
ncbi:hypothetical protein EV363DRAFT_720197 [Boletus edulis]|nr:hypothetical protein EV363DRAFT_720197 [Boletus edulis]